MLQGFTLSVSGLFSQRRAIHTVPKTTTFLKGLRNESLALDTHLGEIYTNKIHQLSNLQTLCLLCVALFSQPR